MYASHKQAATLYGVINLLMMFYVAFSEIEVKILGRYVDPCLSNPCAKNAVCRPNFYFSDFACTCPDGFTGDGVRTCTELNNCTEFTPCFSNDSACRSNMTKCMCNEGFEWNMETATCEDIDECAGSHNRCNDPINGTICINVDGGYTCSCDLDFTIPARDQQENLYCIQKRPITCNSVVNGGCEQNCIDAQDRLHERKCSCVDGYVLNSDLMTCSFNESSDFIACAKKNSCGDPAAGVCLNNTCFCFDGYEVDERNMCKPKGDCRTINNDCYHGFKCVSSPWQPGYSCGCDTQHNKFALGPLGRCYDTDECMETPGICGNNSLCLNTHGSYSCGCMPGFIANGSACVENDPCINATAKEDCAGQNKFCRSTSDGDYECYCPLPYHLAKTEDMCIPSVSSFTGELTMILQDKYERTYLVERFLEEKLYMMASVLTISDDVLNLEVISITEAANFEGTQVRANIQFTTEMPYLGLVLNEICAEYALNEVAACILPGNFIVRPGSISFTAIADICKIHPGQTEEFLCGNLAICTGNATGFACSCKNGFRQDGFYYPTKPKCVDIDECALNPSICKTPSRGTCVNFDGGYTCNCSRCYEWDVSHSDCLNVCSSKPCKHDGHCEEQLIGDQHCGFQCTCNPYYYGPTCTLINEEVRAAPKNVAITGGVLGGLLLITMAGGICLVFKIMKRKGYFS